MMVLLICLFSVTFAYADNPYVGVFLAGDPLQTEKVLFYTNFLGMDGDDLASGDWIAGVLSAASADGDEDTGYMIQNGFLCKDTERVRWSCQIHYRGEWYNEEKWYERNVGRDYHERFYGKIYFSGDNLKFKAYVYEDHLDLERDSPSIYTYTWTDIDSIATNFLAGFDETTGCQYLQAGAEANEELTNYWRVKTFNLCYYYNSAWRYMLGMSNQGDVSWINYYPDTEELQRVGGKEFKHGDTYAYYTDKVTWERDDMLDEWTVLWYSSGTVTEDITTPYS